MLRLTSLLGNSQCLDGGAMFGNAPRALWQQWLPPDDQGRVPLVCRALLVDDGERKLLLETGIGSFFEPKFKDRYGVVESSHVLLDSLAALGLSHADIDGVVLSHLHFDHAGGLLAPFEEGVVPRLLFPNAQYLVGQAAFQRATAPHRRDRASFIPELPELLEGSGRLRLIEDGVPSCDWLGPKFRLYWSDGHTPGMLLTEVVGSQARVVFCADLIPGVPWVHLPISMGYDRFPERLIDEKQAFYEGRLDGRSALYFTHDPDTALAFLCRDERGRYGVEASVGAVSGWDLDTDARPPPAG